MSKLSWSLKLTEEELNDQVQNYNILKVSKSYRGISALLLVLSSLLTLVLVYFKFATAWAIVDVVLMLIFAYLIYKGYVWAIILAMILWTFERLYMITSSLNPALGILGWLIYIMYFYKAFQVEQARKKLSKNLPV